MNQSSDKKSSLWTSFTKQYSGALTHVALSALSAWMIVTGLKGLAGFTVNRQTALADLLGIILVVAVARWFSLKNKSK